MDQIAGRGFSAIDFAIEHAKNDPVGTYGPWLAGLLGFTLMTGVIAAQSTRYFSTFGFESRGLFTIVVLCIVSVLTQWAVIIHASWNWLVARFGDYSVFAEAPWQVWLQPIIGQVTVFIAQVFFAHRCYTLYDRNKIIFSGLLFGMLATLMLFTVAGVATAIDPFKFDVVKNLTAPTLCVNLVTDLAITGFMLWKLGLGGGQSYSPNTEDVLRRLRNLTVEAAVPPAICALLTMATYLSMNEQNLAFVTFAMITPSLYVWSLMLTLNSRSAIRQKFYAPNDGGFFDAEFNRTNVLEPDSKAGQTASRRTTVVLALSGPAFAPNSSMGIVNERVEGSQGLELYGRKSRDDDELTTPWASQKELRVDLDRWENDAPPGSPSSASASMRSQRTTQAPPLIMPSNVV